MKVPREDYEDMEDVEANLKLAIARLDGIYDDIELDNFSSAVNRMKALASFTRSAEVTARRLHLRLEARERQIKL